MRLPRMIALPIVATLMLAASSYGANAAALPTTTWLPQYDGSRAYVDQAVSRSNAPVSEAQLRDLIKNHKGSLDVYIVVTQQAGPISDLRNPAHAPLGTLVSHWTTQKQFSLNGKQVVVLAIQSARPDRPNAYAFDFVTGEDLSKLGLTPESLASRGVLRNTLSQNQLNLTGRLGALLDQVDSLSRQAEDERDAVPNAIRNIFLFILIGGSVFYVVVLKVAEKRIETFGEQFSGLVDRYLELDQAAKYDDKQKKQQLAQIEPHWEALRAALEAAKTEVKSNRFWGPIKGTILLRSVGPQHLSAEVILNKLESSLPK